MNARLKEELITILDNISYPYAYSHFAEGEKPEPPFICYNVRESENFLADGGTYYKINLIQLELYTQKKDYDAEAKTEDTLDEHHLFYNHYEAWIESEKLYQNLYEFYM